MQEHDFDISDDSDPVTYEEAISSLHSNFWLNAMEDEMKSMASNGSLRLKETLMIKWTGIRLDLLPKGLARKKKLITQRHSLPYLQGGSSGLGGSYVLREEVEGVLPLEIVVANEMKGGCNQEGMMVEYGQGEDIVEATPLAVEGYEKWEDSMLVKFSEFLGFATEGFETQIIELMRQMVKTQNKGPRPGQTPVSRCERELKKLECTINYGGQRSGKSANRDRGNFLLKLG